MSTSLQAEIDAFSKQPPCNDAHVDEMEFRKQKVYLFAPGTCGADMTSDVRDINGKLLGTLGGITGNHKIQGESFDSARLLRVVWQK